jgi:hypothetical protein
MTKAFRPIRKLRNEERNKRRRLAREGITVPLTATLPIYPSEIREIKFSPAQQIKLDEIVKKAMARAHKPFLKQCMLMKRAIEQGKKQLALMRQLLAILTT